MGLEGVEGLIGISRDKINEIIDLGRTPDQVYRQRSQPN